MITLGLWALVLIIICSVWMGFLVAAIIKSGGG